VSVDITTLQHSIRHKNHHRFTDGWSVKSSLLRYQIVILGKISPILTESWCYLLRATFYKTTKERVIYRGCRKQKRYTNEVVEIVCQTAIITTIIIKQHRFLFVTKRRALSACSFFSITTSLFPFLSITCSPTTSVACQLPPDVTTTELCIKVLFIHQLMHYWVVLKTVLKLALTFWRRNYFFLILAHPVYKIWIIQEPNMLELWNKLHFEEKKNGEYTQCLKYSVPIFVE